VSLPQEIESFMKRPGMYIQPVNLDTACSFLNGYATATVGDPLVGFHEWLVTRVGHGNNLAWPYLIECLAFPDADDPSAERQAADSKEMVDFLFRSLREFQADLESRHGLRGVYLRYERWLRTQDWYRSGCPLWIPVDER
jgi:hypothetical protein